MIRGCPFCGEPGKYYNVNSASHYIACDGCHCQSAYWSTQDEAILAWNKRHLQDKLLADRTTYQQEILDLRGRLLELNKKLEQISKTQFDLDDFLK